MTAIRTSFQNAFETTLTAEMGPNDLTALVASVGILTSPCLLAIEAEDDGQREFIYFNGSFTSTTFVTSAIGNRYLPGSAASSNLTHPPGASVWCVPQARHFEDLHDRIDTLDHDQLQGLADNDHPQYYIAANHTKAAHDALAINAGTLDGIDSTGFALLAHEHDSEYSALVHVHNTLYAPLAHVGTGGAEHPVATGSVAGFLSASDKTKLDTVDSNAEENLSAAAMLSALLGVDGAGSGLDADLLDGIQLAALLSGLTDIVVTLNSSAVAITTSLTDHQSITWTKPGGWTSAKLFVIASCNITGGGTSVTVLSSLYVDGDQQGLVQKSYPGTTTSHSVVQMGYKSVSANTTIKMSSQRSGGSVNPSATQTQYIVLALRTA